MSTIAAISTAPTTGGIGIIRISGEKSFDIIKKIFVPKDKSKKIEVYKMQYGNIVSEEKIIDEVLVSFFVAPKSYTTENMCEINSHGGIIVMNKILNLCLENGAEIAEPGEFTKRAFINGRIDLSQAEAIADIINAKSQKEAEASVNQLEGFLSKEVNKIKAKVLELLAFIEANIDYPEYDVETISNKKAKEKINEIECDLKALEKSFDNGKIIKEGIKTVIIGKPNAGKSSLLNELAREEKAIVTDIAGTTRDCIEEEILIEGIPFKIIDTAGIRDTDNKIEQIGIEKAKALLEKSDLIIAIFDNSKDLTEEDKKILETIKNKKAIILLNKIDIEDKHLEEKEEIKKTNKKVIKVSLLNKQGIDEIYKELVRMFNLDEIKIDDSAIITNTRHKVLIEKARNCAQCAKQDISGNMPLDITAINIKNIAENLGEITGDNVSEDIIKEIFSRFCLGK